MELPLRRPIRVLLVDDSMVALVVLRRLLQGFPDIVVAGEAHNGREALEQVALCAPDVVVTDLHMPHLDGLAFTRALMATRPLPILVLSVSVQKDQTTNIFRLLDAGAVDVMAKPLGGLSAAGGLDGRELAARIRILSGVVPMHRFHAAPARDEGLRDPARTDRPAPSGAPTAPEPEAPAMAVPPAVVALGASTGGPVVLRDILAALPRDFSCPVLCVQHISSGFGGQLAQWLDAEVGLSVRLARTGDRLEPGQVLVAPDELHLTVGAGRRILLRPDEPRGGHRPSIDVLFESLAREMGPAVFAGLFTGMGRDGADGLAAVARAGGTTLVQSPGDCVVSSMPEQALRVARVDHVLPVAAVPALLERLRCRGQG